LQKAWSGSSLEAYCRQVNTCIDIAFKCMESNKDKRPHIANVAQQLDEIENEIGKVTSYNFFGDFLFSPYLSLIILYFLYLLMCVCHTYF
jgi:hypothetical protein